MRISDWSSDVRSSDLPYRTSEEIPVPRSRTAAALAAGAALLLTGCSTASSTTAGDDVDAGGDGAFPVTIEHAFGETVIESAPERVATVAWANHEVPLALGIVPVGMEKAAWGDDDGDGILPWVEEKLEELGGETPVQIGRAH